MGSLCIFSSWRQACCLPSCGMRLKIPSNLGQAVGRASSTVRCMSSESEQRKSSLVFLGTPNVAADVLGVLFDAAAESQSLFEVAAVITQPPSVRGRGRKQLPSPVEQLALQRKFPAARIFSPVKAGEENFLSELKALKPDVCITAAYGNILPKRFLDIPLHGTVNVHPSLLPLYRGAAPVQRAIQDGMTVSGVTIAYTVRALDAGPIIAAESMDVDSVIKAPELLQTLFLKGSQVLLKELPAILNGSARASAIEQDDTKATLAPKITADESWLNLEEPAEVLHNKVRAFAEWPGCRIAVQVLTSSGDRQNLELKVVTSRIGSSKNASGREISLVKDALAVPCGGGSVLEVLDLQPPAKKVMSARDFSNGLTGKTLLKDTARSETSLSLS